MIVGMETMLDCSVEGWVDELIREGHLPADQRQEKISDLYRKQLAAAHRKAQRQAATITKLMRRIRAV